MSRQYILIGGASAVVALSGFAAGFFTAKRMLEPQYVELAEKEIEEAKEYYSRLYKKEEFSNPVELVTVREQQEIITEYSYASEHDSPQEIVTQEDAEMQDLLAEIAICKEHGHPYLISKEEYFENGSDYAQVTITYFEDDDVLVDEDDSMISDVGDTVGLKQLTRFGVLSGDHNIVYVRNEAKEIDFEIVRNKGNYAKDVLGFIEHSSDPKVRKFRRDYE